MGNSFHQAAVAKEHVAIVVDYVETGAIELGSQNFFRQRHTYCVGDALSQRAGGSFHAGCVAIFGMAGSFGMKLAETLDLLHRQIVAGKVQQRINQHRAMPVGQHEAIAVSPLGVGGIVAQMMNP